MHPLFDVGLDDRAAAPISVRRLGRRTYADACALQEAAAREVAAGAPDRLLVVEHPPVVTLGRGARPDQLLVSPRGLARRGIAVVETDRGGGATYHGPGQIVGYPIVDLRRRRLTVRRYLGVLEDALTTALAAEGIVAYTRPGLTGVWTDGGKIAAIGIAVRSGVARHGFALNVDTDMSGFGAIVPCGLQQPVVSMRQLGWDGRAGDVLGSLVGAIGGAL